MSKDITEGILLRAGFKEKERIDKIRTVFELTSYDLNDSDTQYWSVTMTNYPSYCGRKWNCEVSSNSETDYAEVDIQTTGKGTYARELHDFFNKFQPKE